MKHEKNGRCPVSEVAAGAGKIDIFIRDAGKIDIFIRDAGILSPLK